MAASASSIVWCIGANTVSGIQYINNPAIVATAAKMLTGKAMLRPGNRPWGVKRKALGYIEDWYTRENFEEDLACGFIDKLQCIAMDT